jgi:uncharacterized protein YkwD
MFQLSGSMVGSRCLALALFLGVLAAVPFASQAQSSLVVDSEEEVMIRLINEYRAQKGLGRLTLSYSLTKAADWMSSDMGVKNYFGHHDSQGRDPFVRMKDFGYKFRTTKGENLAAGFSDAVNTFQQWKNSPSHNAAMLNSQFKVIGISRTLIKNSQYRWYWTTDFGGQVESGSLEMLRASNK